MVPQGKLVLALLLSLLPQLSSHKVLVAWQPFVNADPEAGVSSTATNPGQYKVYRCLVQSDGTCPNPQVVAWVPQLWDKTVNPPVPQAPQLVDAAVLSGQSYSYQVSYIQTPSGTPTSIETALSDPVSVGPL